MSNILYYMESVLFVSYILLFSLSCVGSGSNYLIHKFLKLPLTKNILLLFFTLLIDIGRSLLYSYFLSLGITPKLLFPLNLIIGIIIVSVFYYYIFKALILLKNVSPVVVKSFTAAVLFLQIAVRIILYFGRFQIANIVYPLLVIIISGYLFYVGLSLKNGVDKNWNHALKTFINKIGIFTLIFAPLSAAIYMVVYFIGDHKLDLFFLDFLYLGISSVVSISFLLSYLTKLGTIPYKTTVDQSLKDNFNISPRETDVLELLLKGKTNKQIGETLFISITTVRTHISHIFEKTEVKSRMELVSKILSS